jgi:hypothetical protein
MKTRLVLLPLIVAGTMLLHAQAPPQNARQALLEMLFGKPGSLEKHLPKATLAIIHKSAGAGATPFAQLSMLSALANAPGSQLQTFESGSTLLVYNDEASHSKFEADIESDDLRGDEDEIQLSFQASREGQQVGSPVMPTLTLLMKQESAIWKLNTVSVTIRVSLSDPEFLKTIMAGSEQKATGLGAIAAGNPGARTGQGRPNEASAIASLRTIVTAETAYSITYPNRGFTCTLSDLDGFGSDSPNEHQAMLIESGLASGRKAGYIFVLSGCTGLRSPQFMLSAVPANAGTAHTFCTDQTGVIRSASDAQAATCASSGKRLQ